MIATEPAVKTSFLLRFSSILLFVGLPWILILILMPFPAVPDEFQQKFEAFQRRPQIDSIVIGDSRVMRIDEDQFNFRGWAFFNMGFSGLSPEDVEMSLNFAIARRPIRRVVIGLSFENMTQSFPYEFSSYRTSFENLQTSYAKTPRSLVSSVTEGEVQNIGLIDKTKGLIVKARFQELADKTLVKANSILNNPVKRASSRLHMLLNNLGIKPLPNIFLPDGSAAYMHIKDELKNGRYDLRKNQDVGVFWDRPDGEVRYIERGTLSESAKAVYLRIFETLKQRGIPVVAFETGKIPAYQQRIDSHPLLYQLQSEWRTFYREHQSSCLRFLEFDKMKGVYDTDDFIDATHFIGATEFRLTERILNVFDNMDAVCSSMEIDGSPKNAKGE